MFFGISYFGIVEQRIMIIKNTVADGVRVHYSFLGIPLFSMIFFNKMLAKC